MFEQGFPRTSFFLCRYHSTKSPE